MGRGLIRLRPIAPAGVIPSVGITQIRLRVEGHTLLSACLQAPRVFVWVYYIRIPGGAQGGSLPPQRAWAW